MGECMNNHNTGLTNEEVLKSRKEYGSNLITQKNTQLPTK